jgi:DNA replication and repair protein RecF
VSFVPADLHLVDGPPSVRRSFLNGALAQDQKQYYRDLAAYQKVLGQKGSLLRGEAQPDSELMKIYNETLVTAGTALMIARNHFIRALAVSAAQVHARWSGQQERLELSYRPNVPFDTETEDSIAASFSERLRAGAEQERLRGIPLFGPHRDDLGLDLDGRSLAAFGSQGQQRTAVLAVKVAEYTVMHERSGEAPLLLLDDVLSELDAQRARAFLDGVGGFEQAFITATQLPDALPAGTLYDIENANVRVRPL